MRLGQHGDQGGGGDELHGIVLPDRLAPQAHGQMRLAGAGRAEQQGRVAMRDPSTGRQFADLARVERWLRVELEAGELAHEGKLRDLAGHRDAALVPSGDLALDEEPQRLAQGHLRAGRLVQQDIELVPDRGELEPVQHRHQRFVVDRDHHQLPPATASYSASGRSKAGSGVDGAGASRTGPAPTRPARCARSVIHCRRPAQSG